MVLVLQRLEVEKHTDDAIRIWRASGLGDAGWTLRVVGDGDQRGRLIALAEAENVSSSVSFTGWSNAPERELARTSMLLATATEEPYGLSVLEAMAAGVPVVATASGGHLETIGSVPQAPLFRPGDVQEGGALLRALAHDEGRRVALGQASRDAQQRDFTLVHHVDALLRSYLAAQAARSGRLNR